MSRPQQAPWSDHSEHIFKKCSLSSSYNFLHPPTTPLPSYSNNLFNTLFSNALSVFVLPLSETDPTPYHFVTDYFETMWNEEAAS